MNLYMQLPHAMTTLCDYIQIVCSKRHLFMCNIFRFEVMDWCLLQNSQITNPRLIYFLLNGVNHSLKLKFSSLYNVDVEWINQWTLSQ